MLKDYTLATLWVKQKPGGSIPFKLFLKPQPTSPVAYLSGGEEPIRIQLSQVSESDSRIHNRPNPFKDMTTILYQSNRQEDAVLNFFDLNGRLVLKREVRLIIGENEFVVHQAELMGPGMYTYEINSVYQHSTNRMIIVD